MLFQDQFHRTGGAQRQQLLDLPTGRVAAGVHDPGPGVGGLPGHQQHPVLSIEVDSEFDQLADPPGSLLHQRLHRPGVAEAPARGHGVGGVEQRAVVRVDGGGYPPLGVAAAALLHGRLGEHGHLKPRLGSLDGAKEPRDPAPDHHQVETALVGLDRDRLAHQRLARGGDASNEVSIRWTPSTPAATSTRVSPLASITGRKSAGSTTPA